jgi:hypothetical protein
MGSEDVGRQSNQFHLSCERIRPLEPVCILYVDGAFDQRAHNSVRFWGQANPAEGELRGSPDHTFRRSVFLLDGFEFDHCDFDECAFALRGQPFMLSGNKLGNLTLMKLTEIQNSYNITEFMAENGIPTFLQAAEKLGQVAANRRKRETDSDTAGAQ